MIILVDLILPSNFIHIIHMNISIFQIKPFIANLFVRILFSLTILIVNLFPIPTLSNSYDNIGRKIIK